MTASPPSCQYESPSVLLFFLPNETHVLRFKPVSSRCVWLGPSLLLTAAPRGTQTQKNKGCKRSVTMETEKALIHRERPAGCRSSDPHQETWLRHELILTCFDLQNNNNKKISELLIRCGHVHPCSVNFRRHFNKNQRIWEFPVGAKLFHKHVSRWVQMLMRIGLILTNRRKGLKVHRCTITQCHSKFR